METKKTTLYLNVENIKKLKMEALEENVSLSSIVDKLIAKYLKEKKNE